MRSVAAIAVVFALLSTAIGAQAAPRAVTVHPLDCGRIDLAVVSCYLIRHPKGDLLWDAGVGDQFSARVPVTIESQLRALGTKLDSIDYLAFSNEQVDHIGNANAVIRAIWLLNRREHAWTIARDGEFGRPPPLLAASTRRHVEMIDAEYDVFGDRTVRIIPAPGPTPGHQVLFVARSAASPVILAGDSEAPASMAQVRALAERTGATILIGHSREGMMTAP